MGITDNKKKERFQRESVTGPSASIIHCELKRNQTKIIGRGILIEAETLKFFEGLTEVQNSKLHGKLINDALRYVKSEMDAGKIKIHFTK